MYKPLTIQGVGHGSMDCGWLLRSPIAMADDNGETRMHSIDAPIVDGAGKDLPGLLGLRILGRE